MKLRVKWNFVIFRKKLILLWVFFENPLGIFENPLGIFENPLSVFENPLGCGGFFGKKFWRKNLESIIFDGAKPLPHIRAPHCPLNGPGAHHVLPCQFNDDLKKM